MIIFNLAHNVKQKTRNDTTGRRTNVVASRLCVELTK